MSNPFSKKENSQLLTLFLKLIFVVIIFFVIPYSIVVVSRRYQDTALDIVVTPDIQSNASDVLVQSSGTENPSGIKILTRTEVNTLAQINDFIVGTWVGFENKSYKIQINSNNRFEEFYNDEKEGFGTWRVFSGIKSEVNTSNEPDFVLGSNGEVNVAPSKTNTPIENVSVLENKSSSTITTVYSQERFNNPNAKDPKYFFQKVQAEPKHQGQINVYQIQLLDEEGLILVFRGGSNKPLIFKRDTSSPVF